MKEWKKEDIYNLRFENLQVLDERMKPFKLFKREY